VFTKGAVKDKAACFSLNVLQSVELNLPVFVAEATGRLKVCVSPLETIAKFVPLVPVVISYLKKPSL
jgi:hypothetical protein